MLGTDHVSRTGKPLFVRYDCAILGRSIGRDEYFREDYVNLLRGLLVHRYIESDSSAERGRNISIQGAQVCILWCYTSLHAAWILMLDDCADVALILRGEL